MTTTDRGPQLPAAFADLEAYCPAWCPPTERERAGKRVSTPIEALRAFQAVLAPRVEAMIQHLNQFPNDPAALPAPEQRLYQLAQMAMEASVPVDLDWKSSDIEEVFPLERMTFSAGTPGRLTA